jgi:hypothetical protein
VLAFQVRLTLWEPDPSPPPPPPLPDPPPEPAEFKLQPARKLASTATSAQETLRFVHINMHYAHDIGKRLEAQQTCSGSVGMCPWVTVTTEKVDDCNGDSGVSRRFEFGSFLTRVCRQTLSSKAHKTGTAAL